MSTDKNNVFMLHVYSTKRALDAFRRACESWKYNSPVLTLLTTVGRVYLPVPSNNGSPATDDYDNSHGDDKDDSCCRRTDDERKLLLDTGVILF